MADEREEYSGLTARPREERDEPGEVEFDEGRTKGVTGGDAPEEQEEQ